MGGGGGVYCYHLRDTNSNMGVDRWGPGGMCHFPLHPPSRNTSIILCVILTLTVPFASSTLLPVGTEDPDSFRYIILFTQKINE